MRAYSCSGTVAWCGAWIVMPPALLHRPTCERGWEKRKPADRAGQHYQLGVEHPIPPYHKALRATEIHSQRCTTCSRRARFSELIEGAGLRRWRHWPEGTTIKWKRRSRPGASLSQRLPVARRSDGGLFFVQRTPAFSSRHPRFDGWYASLAEKPNRRHSAGERP